MNILMLSSALIGFSTKTRGGPTIWSENFIKFFRNKGHQVFGLSIGRFQSDRKIEPYLKERLYDCGNPFNRLWVLESLVFVKMAESFFSARKAVRICKTHKIDVIIGTGVHECAGLYLVSPPAPLIISIRGDYTKEIPLWLSGDPHFQRHQKMYEVMEFMALKSSSCVTLVSHWLKNRLSSCLLPKKQFVIPNPLRMYTKPWDDSAKPLRIPHDKRIIITISSFHNQHRLEGLKIFAKAAHIINRNDPRVHFLVLGGSQSQRYFNHVKELTSGLSITFAEYREDIIDILRKGDLYLHCSVLETFSNAIIEAMSVGLPIVSTKVGGIPEIISDRVDGMLTDLDPETVAATVLKVLRGRKLASTLGKAARRKVMEKYTWEVIGPQWENILGEVTQK